MATRFVATNECDASEEFKKAYINAKEEDIKIIKSPVGMPGRAIYNEFIQNIQSTADVWFSDDGVMPVYNKNRIISLQTCNSGADDGIRCVLFAKCLSEY